MLDRLETAIQRFESIRNDALPGQKALAWSLWMERDVCAIADDLIGRADFRAYARWPIDHLQRQSTSRERTLVDQVDADLVHWSGLLASFAKREDISTSLRRLGRYQETLQSGESAWSERQGELVEKIAQRPWRDLVCVEDYFHPATELNLNQPSQPDSGRVRAIAEFTPYFNPRLQRLGDFVQRMLFLRIERWQHILNCFQARCQTVRPRTGNREDPDWRAITESRSKQRADLDQLRACFVSTEARVREACIALLQVFVDYRQGVDIQWLGLGIKPVSGLLKHHVERQPACDVANQVAEALLEVASLCRQEVDPDTAILENARRFPLVVVALIGRREVYWQGSQVEVDWHENDALWSLFVALVERMRSGQGVDPIDVNYSKPRPLKDSRSRLADLLPPDLDDAIEPAGRGTYRLTLPSNQVSIIRSEVEDRLFSRLGFVPNNLQLPPAGS